MRAAERLSPNPHTSCIALDYPTSARDRPRWGHGAPAHETLAALIEAHGDRYKTVLEELAQYAGDFSRIPQEEEAPLEPYWRNTWLSGLDAASIYGFIRSLAPGRYVEIGSGNSTKFAARAKRDGALPTQITSIDPHPTAAVDTLCDRVVRQPLELVDLTVFDELEAGDLLFFDGSHRAFMNSDVTVFFLDILPGLAPGVRVGIHDITLPSDYPLELAERHYSEQYLLASYLLGGNTLQPVLPCAYVSDEPSLWTSPALAGLPRGGSAFWSDVAA
jgi:hypothetical protein